MELQQGGEQEVEEEEVEMEEEVLGVEPDGELEAEEVLALIGGGKKTRKRKKRKSRESLQTTNEEKVVQEKEKARARRAEAKNRRVRRKTALQLDENGRLDLAKITMKDLIRHAGNIGRPMKAPGGGGDDGVREREESVSEAPNRSPVPIPPPQPKSARAALKVQIVNGKIVINEESLVASAAEVPPTFDEYNVVYETGHHTTSSSYTNRSPSEKWSTEETDLFYRALCQYGTDFTLIEKLFPTRTRRQIKNKFKKEEKVDRKRIDDALCHRVPIDVEQYRTLSGIKKQMESKKQQRDKGGIEKEEVEEEGKEKEEEEGKEKVRKEIGEGKVEVLPVVLHHEPILEEDRRPHRSKHMQPSLSILQADPFGEEEEEIIGTI